MGGEIYFWRENKEANAGPISCCCDFCRSGRGPNAGLSMHTPHCRLLYWSYILNFKQYAILQFCNIEICKCRAFCAHTILQTASEFHIEANVQYCTIPFSDICRKLSSFFDLGKPQNKDEHDRSAVKRGTPKRRTSFVEIVFKIKWIARIEGEHQRRGLVTFNLWRIGLRHKREHQIYRFCVRCDWPCELFVRHEMRTENILCPNIADCPAMSFVFVCWQRIEIQMQISWVGRSTSSNSSFSWRQNKHESMRGTIFHNVKECFDILVKISQWEKLQIELRTTKRQIMHRQTQRESFRCKTG